LDLCELQADAKLTDAMAEGCDNSPNGTHFGECSLTLIKTSKEYHRARHLGTQLAAG
jgi:hypothetical protein